MVDYQDFVVPFAVGRSNLGKVKNRSLKWPDFMKMFKQPSRTAETQKQFFALGIEEQTKLKNVDGFILGGHSIDGRRRRTSILERSYLTIDLEGDDFSVEMFDSLLNGNSDISEYEWMLHTSRKHTEERPRARLNVPTTRPVTAEEYEAVVRIFTAKLDPSLDSMDPVSVRHSQMMFKPTASKDGVYVFHHNQGEMLDPDGLLGSWPHDWRDYSKLPYSVKHKKARKTKDKADDPREKQGLVGAFCRAYGIETAIGEFLGDLYEEVGPEGSDVRYTFLGGTTHGGAVVYDDTFLYSHHTHDPAAGQLCNAFDLVRIHLFGDLDGDVKEKTPPTGWPSYKAMVKRFGPDPAVLAEYDPPSADEMFPVLDDEEEDISADAEGASAAENLYGALLGLEPEPDSEPASKPKKTRKETPLEFMNRQHAVAHIGLGKVVILSFHDEDLGYGSPTDINHLHFNHKMPAPNGGSQTRFQWWMEQPGRRTYRGGVVFEPGRNTEPRAYNLWRGPSVERDPDHSKCQLILRHVLEVIAAGNEEYADYLLNWAAHMVQKPWEKPGVAIGLNGPKGSGKDTWAVALGKMFRSHYVTVTKMDHLTGRFNAHEAQALLIHCPDAVWGGNHAAVGPLNNLITGEETMIDKKHVDQFNVRSYCRVFITSNEEWVIPASPDERRWAVFDVSSEHMQDVSYFRPLWEEIGSGSAPGPGIGALLDYLSVRDITNFVPQHFPHTEGLSRQKVLTYKGVDQFLFDMLTDGELPGSAADEHFKTEEEEDDWESAPVQVGKDDFYNAYREWHKERRYDGELRAKDYVCQKLIERIPGIETFRPRRQKRRFVLPPLGLCRERFAASMKSKIVWPADSEEDAPSII